MLKTTEALVSAILLISMLTYFTVPKNIKEKNTMKVFLSTLLEEYRSYLGSTVFEDPERAYETIISAFPPGYSGEIKISYIFKAPIVKYSRKPLPYEFYLLLPAESRVYSKYQTFLVNNWYRVRFVIKNLSNESVVNSTYYFAISLYKPMQSNMLLPIDTSSIKLFLEGKPVNWKVIDAKEYDNRVDVIIKATNLNLLPNEEKYGFVYYLAGDDYEG